MWAMAYLDKAYATTYFGQADCVHYQGLELGQFGPIFVSQASLPTSGTAGPPSSTRLRFVAPPSLSDCILFISLWGCSRVFFSSLWRSFVEFWSCFGRSPPSSCPQGGFHRTEQAHLTSQPTKTRPKFHEKTSRGKKDTRRHPERKKKDTRASPEREKE